MLRKLIRWARITKAGTDAEQFPVQQVEYMGKVADSLMVFPYGMHGNVPADSLGLMFAVGGNPENRATIGFAPQDRPTLEEGEVAFYHPLLPNLIIKLQASGEMLIQSDLKINIVAPETEFTGIVKANGKVIDDTHQHSQANDSNGDSQVNINGVL